MRVKLSELVSKRPSHLIFDDTQKNFSDILKENDVVIVDTESYVGNEYANLLGSFALLRLKQILLKEERSNLFLYLDDAYKYLPVFHELFEASQFKHIGLTLFVQDRHQLNSLCPNGVANQTFMESNIANLLLLDRISNEDIGYFQREFNSIPFVDNQGGTCAYRVVNEQGNTLRGRGKFFCNETAQVGISQYPHYKNKLIAKVLKRKQDVEDKQREENKNVIEFMSIEEDEEDLISE
jgi:hypothetical protein